MIKCPRCGEKIDYVKVYSQCVQTGTLNDEGSIISYDDLEVLSTEEIECPECCEVITNNIKED